jgi:YHS domain-containing protein
MHTHTEPTRSHQPALTGLRWLIAAVTVAVAGVTVASAQPAATDTGPRSVTKYQLGKQQLGAQGYDVVAYFPEGDTKGEGRAVKGDKKHELVHRGVRYRFSSAANLERFRKNPTRYEPAYGGWCAYAAAHEGYTKPDPKNFVVQNDRLMLFYKSVFTDTKKSWNKEGPSRLEPRADAFWKTETGETPPARDARKAPA